MAIVYEAKRQVELLESGKLIDQETRLFDTKKNECCDPSDSECYDVSDLTFCDKQRFLEIINEYTDIDIPWNGISNIYNPRCDIKVEPHTDNTPDYYENNNEYGYIKSLLVYSLLVMVFVFVDFIFGNEK